MTLRILSWNIWFGTYFEKVKDFLKKSHADIIGLQEVTQTPDGKNNLAKLLAIEQGYSYVYATGMDLRKHSKPLVMGNAILSKYPIISSETHILSKTESRVAIGADIEIKNTKLDVFSTHLLHTHQQPSEIQEEQARNLVKIAPKEKTLIMGDFNATPESASVKLMRQSFTNAGGNAFAPTWSVYPEGCSECNLQEVNTRLDYIFTTKDIRQKSFSILQSDASDHLPISMEIEI